MATQMMMRLDEALKKRLQKQAGMEGKTTSQIMRELIENYLRERDIGAYIDDLWNRIGKDLRSKGVAPRDVQEAVRGVRKTSK